MHGWLILDKPAGISSAKAVADVKRILKPSKIGHAGTLDPLASGVLPLAIGEATKTVSYVMADRKEYCFSVRWGEERATGDAAGEVTKTSLKRPSREEIEMMLPVFVGSVMQTPPAYSAIKVGGKRSYAMARAGQEVTLQPRKVDIYHFELISIDSADQATFRAECGKGTYIRVLAEDLARKLGTVGYVSMLRRTGVGKFKESHTISLAKLGELVHIGAPDFGLLPVESVLDDILAIAADLNQTQKLKQGQAIPLFDGIADQTICKMMHGGKLVALVEAVAGSFKPVRVFNY